VLDAGGLELVALAPDHVGLHALWIPARPERDGERRFRAVASHPLDDLRRALGIEADGVEAVAPLGGAPVRGFAAATDPDRDAVRGLGLHLHRVEVHELTVEVDRIRTPARAQDVEHLVHAAAAVGERLTEGGELGRRPPDAGADGQAPTRERVEAGQRVGEREWVVLGHDEHAGAEPDPLGRGCRPGKGEQRVVQVRRRVVLRGGDRDVVADPHVGEPERLRQPRRVGDGGGARRPAELREVDADLHGRRLRAATGRAPGSAS
jgi:hypothetical protein